MALDPKYADLPWIAHNQPDVYEAGELPEVDQKGNKADCEILPKEIERINLSVSEAHQRFAACKLNSLNVDFSDSIASPSKSGYIIDTHDYDILPLGSRDNEPLASRVQRLQAEVAQLVNDINTTPDLGSGDGCSSSNLTQLSNVAEYLRHQLKDLEMRCFGSLQLAPVEDNDYALSQVLGQMTAFKPERSAVDTLSEPTPLVYEIYHRQDWSKQVDLERVSDLDRRIQRLETLLGQPDPVKLSALTAETSLRGLLEAVSRLSTKSALLQPSHLDMIEARLAGLQSKLQTITEKRDAISDADTQSKIAELYELVKKWNHVADSLPLIVERLSELKELHEEASEFNYTLSAIEAEQKSLDENLKTYSKLLQDVKTSLEENMENVKKNLSALKARFE